MFLVRANALAMNMSGAGMFSHTVVKCSPIQLRCNLVEYLDLVQVVFQGLCDVGPRRVQRHGEVSDLHLKSPCRVFVFSKRVFPKS